MRCKFRWIFSNARKAHDAVRHVGATINEYTVSSAKSDKGHINIEIDLESWCILLARSQTFPQRSATFLAQFHLGKQIEKRYQAIPNSSFSKDEA